MSPSETPTPSHYKLTPVLTHGVEKEDLEGCVVMSADYQCIALMQAVTCREFL